MIFPDGSLKEGVFKNNVYIGDETMINHLNEDQDYDAEEESEEEMEEDEEAQEMNVQQKQKTIIEDFDNNGSPTSNEKANNLNLRSTKASSGFHLDPNQRG